MSLPPPAPHLLDQVRRWLLDRHLAQFVTIDGAGLPAARSVGVLVKEDWSVDCLAEHGRGRALQAAANPAGACIWNDGNQPVPKLLIIRGHIALEGGDALVAAYDRRMANFVRRGQPRQPRPEADVRAQMVNLHMVPTRIRIEGFGQGTEVFEWTPAGV